MIVMSLVGAVGALQRVRHERDGELERLGPDRRAREDPAVRTFRDLTSLANGAGAVWAQIIAWDLLLGQWVFLESRRLEMSPLATGPLLVLAILLAPIGPAVLLVFRAARRTRSRPAGQAYGKVGGPADS